MLNIADIQSTTEIQGMYPRNAKQGVDSVLFEQLYDGLTDSEGRLQAHNYYIFNRRFVFSESLYANKVQVNQNFSIAELSPEACNLVITG